MLPDKLVKEPLRHFTPIKYMHARIQVIALRFLHLGRHRGERPPSNYDLIFRGTCV